MRLLVYGGNQYNERRRIGEWPEAINGQALQNKYGVSELYASFGVGLLDENPFLIYRVMQVHNQRSYPLTLLLDPGARVWEEFGWNGAALMLALFGAAESPGRTLLKEPERYHSAEHLEALFEGAGPQAAEGEGGQAARPFLQLWAGTVLEDSPVVVGPSEELVGLGSSPSLREAAALLESLPASLRCGRGWLMGGNAGYVAPFGVRFIFDDGRSVAADSEEAKGLLAVRERGAQFLSLLDPSAAGRPAGADDLRTLIERPLFLWERELSHPFESFVADLNLLMSLNDEAAAPDAPAVRRPDALDEKFRRVNERLTGRVPLGDSIAATAYKLLLDDTGTLTPQQTFFFLDQSLKSRAKKMDKSVEPRLNEEAAFEFFVGRRIYPSAAGGKMPEPLRGPVCRRLVETEEDAGELPAIVTREAPHLSPEDDDLRSLVALAVRLSGASGRGLGVWEPYFEEAGIGALVTQHVQSYARVGLKEISRTTLDNYLHFGADPGGRWLYSRFGGEGDEGDEAVRAVVDFLLDELGGDPGGAARRKAAEWLAQLAHTDLRPRLGVGEKLKIGASLGGDWANLLLLEKAFRGEAEKKKRKGAAAAPQPGELPYLAGELCDLAAGHKGSPVAFVPDIERLYAMLGAEHLGPIVSSLAPLAPPLSHPGAAQWVNGWRKLSEQAADGRLAAACRDKYQAEWLRQLLESSAAPVAAADVAGFDEPTRRRVFQELLFGGDETADELRRAKLAGLLKGDRVPDALRDALLAAYERGGEDATKRAALLRRYGRSPEAVDLLSKALGAPAAAELHRWLEERYGEELRQTTLRLRHLLATEPPADHVGRLNEEKAQADLLNKTFFAQALDRAFADIFGANGDGEFTVFEATPEALRLIKRHISAENARLLDVRIGERARAREAESFERLLYGPAVDDAAARRSLTDALITSSAAANETLGAAVEKGLDDAGQREVMFRRLIPARANVRPEREALLSETEGLFERLPEPLRGRFVEELFLHHGGERNEKSFFMGIAFGVFKDLQREVDQRRVGGPKGPKLLKGRAFSDAVLRFVNANDLARTRIAIWAFAESPERIDDYLSDYPRKRAKSGARAKTPAQAPAKEPSADGGDSEEADGGAPPKRLLGWLKRSFTGD